MLDQLIASLDDWYYLRPIIVGVIASIMVGLLSALCADKIPAIDSNEDAKKRLDYYKALAKYGESIGIGGVLITVSLYVLEYIPSNYGPPLLFAIAFSGYSHFVVFLIETIKKNNPLWKSYVTVYFNLRGYPSFVYYFIIFFCTLSACLATYWIGLDYFSSTSN